MLHKYLMIFIFILLYPLATYAYNKLPGIYPRGIIQPGAPKYRIDRSEAYEWENDNNGYWSPLFWDVYLYDNENNATEKFGCFGEYPIEWYKYKKESYHYYNNKIIEEKRYYTPDWESDRTLFFYDENNNIIEELYQDGSTRKLRKIYSYNDKNLLIFENYYFWENGKWIYYQAQDTDWTTSEYEYYDNDSLKTKKEYVWDTDSSKYILDVLYEYEYKPKQRITTQTNLFNNSIPTKRETRTYNDNGYLSEVLHQRYKSEIWTISSKEIYEYDDIGRAVRFLYMKYNSTNEEFENRAKYESQFFDNEGIIESKNYYWENDEWIIDGKFIYRCTPITTSVVGTPIENTELQISPNPVLSGSTISINNVNITSPWDNIYIYDVLGNVIESNEYKVNNGNIELEAPIVPGVYFIRILAGDKNQTTKVIVID